VNHLPKKNQEEANKRIYLILGKVDIVKILLFFRQSK
jgi:hypothetical protein